MDCLADIKSIMIYGFYRILLYFYLVTIKILYTIIFADDKINIKIVL